MLNTLQLKMKTRQELGLILESRYYRHGSQTTSHFFASHARDKTKNIFLYFLTELKTYHISYSIYKHDAIYIADPNSIRHKLRSLRSLCGSVVEDWSAESEDLRFDSSWGLRICYLSHARDKTKNIFLLFFTELKTYRLFYAVYLPPTCFSIPASPT